MAKQPTKHTVKFHGELADKYHKGDFNISADSTTMLFRILFKNVFPNFLNNEKHFTIVFEDTDGNFTEIYDPEQALPSGQLKVHIIPNPDGSFIALANIIYAIIIAIVSVGIAMLLAPKVDMGSSTASGSNWTTPDNVIGQGGVIPVLLGRRMAGSRIVSHGIDSKLYVKNLAPVFKPAGV